MGSWQARRLPSARAAAESNEGLTPKRKNEKSLGYGVNHAATGRATYSNVVMMNSDRMAGVAAFSSDAMPGRVDALLPGHPDAEKLFAVSFKRDCTGEDFCVEVPETFPGASSTALASLVFRAYVQPGAAVSPAPSELVVERILHVVP